MISTHTGFGSPIAASRRRSSWRRRRALDGPAASDRDVEHVLIQMATVEPTLEDVKAAIALLPREDRANLRPWILARYDVQGYRVHGYVEQARPTNEPTP